jgi:hypothetical protein
LSPSQERNRSNMKNLIIELRLYFAELLLDLIIKICPKHEDSVIIVNGIVDICNNILNKPGEP